MSAPIDEKDFEKRLDDALRRNHIDIIQHRGNDADLPEDDSANISSGLASGMRIGLEFMSGTVVGLGLGWWLDTLFDTTPWLLLVFTILGFMAGILNVYRSINNIEEGIGINRQNALTKKPKPNIPGHTD